MVISKPIKRFIITIFMVMGLVITVKVSLWYGLQHAYTQLYDQSQLRLKNLSSYIERILGRFEKVPEVISRHPLLTEVLLEPENKKKNQQLNQLLSDLTSVTEASNVFLINTLGVTVATSNWQQPNSFLGENFAFRPYFLQAINGHSGRYYAVGVSSNKRGYYFSFPIKYRQMILGVIVVKVSIDAIEQQHEPSNNDYHFLITAPDKVIFISDKKEWQLKTLGDIPTPDRKRIAASKRYGNRVISSLKYKTKDLWAMPKSPHASIIETKQQDLTAQYYAVTAKMPHANWQLHVWSSLRPIEEQTSFITIVSISFYVMTLLLAMFIKERIKSGHQLRKSQQLLEQRVATRTEDLTIMNQKLLSEIAERKKTEIALKKTQEELIQSAKLALIGNMSASINHEIKQPLTALRSYAQNTDAFIKKGLIEQAKNNVATMIGLIDRLTNIVSQFKHFTQKSNVKNKRVEVQNCIQSALTIVQHLFHQAKCQQKLELSEQPIYCLGDEIRLEQVLVNLLSNAIQAMSTQENKCVDIKCYTENQQVLIIIRDNGPGILSDNVDKIFQPFFSTKENFGLGLGLSISQRIIDSMKGSLTVKNCKPCGAEFTICLPLHEPNQTSTKQPT